MEQVKLQQQNTNDSGIIANSDTIQRFEKNFFDLNPYIRLIVLSFLRFSDIKRLLCISKLFNYDIFRYLKSVLGEFTSRDCLHFTTDLFSNFFSQYGSKIIRLEISCLGINLITLNTSIPPNQIQRLTLTSCPSIFLAYQNFYSTFSKTYSKSLKQLQISVQSIPEENSPPKSILGQPVNFFFLSSFWKDLEELKKLSIKEATSLESSELQDSQAYNKLLSSIINTPTLNLTTLKLQNLQLSSILSDTELHINFLLKNKDVLQQQQYLDPNSQIQLPQFSINRRFSHLVNVKLFASEQKSQEIYFGINNSSLRFLRELLPPTLQKLAIVDNQYFGASDFKGFEENTLNQFMQTFPEIRQLSFNGYKCLSSISNISLMQMQAQYSNLSRIGIASCAKFESGIINMFLSKNFEHLLDLTLDYTSIQGALSVLVEENVQLNRISIDNCLRVSKEELVSFFKHSNKLKRVSVKQIKGFTKKSLIPLVQNNAQHLEQLFLEKNKIDNLHIAYLLRYCQRIKSLSLRKMDRIHPNFNSNLFQIAQTYGERENYSPVHQRLKYLDISFNSSFEDAIIPAMHYILPNLETIHLDGCSISSIFSFLPWRKTLSVLNLNNNKVQLKSYEEILKFIHNLKNYTSMTSIFIDFQNTHHLEAIEDYEIEWNQQPIIIYEHASLTTKLLQKPKPY